MLDSNKMVTPAATIPLGTDADEPLFEKPWEYAYVVGILMYLSRNYRPDIQFVVNQCDRFTYNPSRISYEAVKRI